MDQSEATISIDEPIRKKPLKRALGNLQQPWQNCFALMKLQTILFSMPKITVSHWSVYQPINTHLINDNFIMIQSFDVAVEFGAGFD